LFSSASFTGAAGVYVFRRGNGFPGSRTIGIAGKTPDKNKRKGVLSRAWHKPATPIAVTIHTTGKYALRRRILSGQMDHQSMEILAFSLVPNLCLKILRTLQTISVSVTLPLSLFLRLLNRFIRQKDSTHISACQVTYHGITEKWRCRQRARKGENTGPRSCFIERAGGAQPCSKKKKICGFLLPRWGAGMRYEV